MFGVAQHTTLKSFSSSQRFFLQQFSELFIAGIYSLCWKSGSYMLAQGIGADTTWLDPYKLLHQIEDKNMSADNGIDSSAVDIAATKNKWV